MTIDYTKCESTLAEATIHLAQAFGGKSKVFTDLNELKLELIPFLKQQEQTLKQLLNKLPEEK